MTVQLDIMNKLKAIENEHAVVILFAVESGSRAWGFESSDSDYDIRFVYKHDINWYLSINRDRDVIEYPLIDNLDFSGWDVQKALKLFYKSNPPLLEWLKSPTVYLEQSTLRSDLIKLQDKYFSPYSCIMHYLHMASGNYREYLKTEFVKTKKYFYVLRPLLACDWITINYSPPPMEFQVLLNAIVNDDILKKEINNLLNRKRIGEELGEEPSIPVINKFIEQRLDFYQSRSGTFQPDRIGTDILDQLFRRTLGYKN